MTRLIAIGSIFLFLMLGACQEREQALAPKEPNTAPGAAEPGKAQPPAGQEQTATGQPAQQQEQPAVAGQEQQQEQPAVAGQEQKKDEFFGQSPSFGNAPETITLEAKNGNVTLSHKAHAEMMDCKTCHGEGQPGKISGFEKDKAHALCQGCHKEKGAGPTKCAECHKK